MNHAPTSTAPPPVLVSVIVPHRNTTEALVRCIESIGSGCAELEHELLVVDNGSDAESRLRLERGYRIFRNARNRGFATACNQAAAVASGQYLLFLNSDVEIHARAIVRMVEALELDPGLAGIAPLQCRPGGRVESPARPWLGPLAQALALLGVARARSPRSTTKPAIGGASWVSAAALLVRRRVFRLVGGFDEEYFFYEEDEDLAWRFARRGYRVAVCPDATVEHYGGLSAEVAGEWPILSLYVGQARFVRRRCGLAGECTYRASTFSAIALKTVVGRLRGRPAPSLARAAPSRVLRLLCSRRMQVPVVEE